MTNKNTPPVEASHPKDKEIDTFLESVEWRENDQTVQKQIADGIEKLSEGACQVLRTDIKKWFAADMVSDFVYKNCEKIESRRLALSILTRQEFNKIFDLEISEQINNLVLFQPNQEETDFTQTGLKILVALDGLSAKFAYEVAANAQREEIAYSTDAGVIKVIKPYLTEHNPI